MSRQIDTTGPISQEEFDYLQGHNDDRWKTAEVEKPKSRPKS